MMKQSRKKSIAFKPSRSRNNVVPPPNSPSQNPSSSDVGVEKVSDPVLKPVILAITNNPKSTALDATNKKVPEPKTAEVLTETSIQSAPGKRKSVANKKVPEPETAKVSIQSAPDKRKSVANKKVPESETAKVSIQSAHDKRESVVNKKVPEPKTKALTESSTQTTPGNRISEAKKKVPEPEPEPEPVTESGNAIEMVSKPEKSGAKRGAIQKVWTSGDEVLVLHALADFTKETGTDPETCHYDFYRYIIAKLSNGEFTKSHVIDKVRKMKKKFKTNLVKSTNEFSNPHDLELFKLSKKFWGDLNPNADGGIKRNHANAGTSQSSKRVKVSSDNVVDDGDTMDVDMEEKRKDFESGFNERYPALMRAFEGKSVPRVTLFDGLKTSLRLVDPSKLQDWDSKCKELHLAEYDVYLRKLSLIHELSSWHYNSIKSPMC